MRHAQRKRTEAPTVRIGPDIQARLGTFPRYGGGRKECQSVERHRSRRQESLPFAVREKFSSDHEGPVLPMRPIESRCKQVPFCGGDMPQLWKKRPHPTRMPSKEKQRQEIWAKEGPKSTVYCYSPGGQHHGRLSAAHGWCEAVSPNDHRSSSQRQAIRDGS